MSDTSSDSSSTSVGYTIVPALTNKLTPCQSASAESGIGLDGQSITLISFGAPDIPSQYVITGSTTYQKLSTVLSARNSFPVMALVFVPSPFPYYRYPLQAEQISLNARRAIIVPRDQQHLLAVVRTATEDRYQVLDDLELGQSSRSMEQILEQIITPIVQSEHLTVRCIKDCANGSDITQRMFSIRDFKKMSTFPTIAFIDTTDGHPKFRTEIPNEAPRSLKVLAAHASKLVEQASMTSNNSLQNIHIARGALHLVACALNAEQTGLSTEQLEYCLRLRSLLSEVEGCIGLGRTPLAQATINNIFGQLCGEHPGAFEIRCSYGKFLEFQRMDEQLVDVQRLPNETHVEASQGTSSNLLKRVKSIPPTLIEGTVSSGVNNIPGPLQTIVDSSQLTVDMSRTSRQLASRSSSADNRSEQMVNPDPSSSSLLSVQPASNVHGEESNAEASTRIKRKHSGDAINISSKRSRSFNWAHQESHPHTDDQTAWYAPRTKPWAPIPSYLDTANLFTLDLPQDPVPNPPFHDFDLTRLSPREIAILDAEIDNLDFVLDEGIEVPKSLTAICEGLQAVIRMAQEKLDNEDSAKLVNMLELHLSTVENQVVKLEEDLMIEDFTMSLDPTIKEPLRSYASKLKEIYNFTKNKETGTEQNLGILGEGLQNFDDIFLKYTRALHLFVASTVEKMQYGQSQIGPVLTNDAPTTYTNRLEGISAHGVLGQCQPGTRIETLKAIRDWENDKDPTDWMFCLLDVAGSGKSTVSKHMDLEWEKDRKLTAWFSFSRDTAETKDTKRFCSVVANAFASRDPILKAFVKQFQNRADWDLLSFEQQFKGLIVDSLKALNRRAILIIDALDECDNEYGQRDTLLNMISDQLPLIPQLRVFVTGRPEHDIKQWAKTTTGVRCVNFLQLEGSHGDVERYIEQRLSDWPSNLRSQVSRVVENSEGVFLWARIACDLLCKTIDKEALLKALEEATLDHLYMIALEQLVPEDSHFRRATVTVLEMILALESPLSIAELSQLSPNPEAIESVVSTLGGILLYKDRNDPIGLVHATLREFLTSETKSGQWFVQPRRGNYFLASGCLELLARATTVEQRSAFTVQENDLKRKERWSKIGSSFTHYLFSAVRYSWVSWVYHYGNSNRKLGLNEHVIEFINTGYEYLLDDSLRANSDEFIEITTSLCWCNMIVRIVMPLASLQTNTLRREYVITVPKFATSLTAGVNSVLVEESTSSD
ncbi:hypothetical protein FRC20_011600 [Serendipita sp. 405]|nr:hypothetical protein FRC20_011600 [Serendipita sp. 405]